jgi:hypothetical protein
MRTALAAVAALLIFSGVAISATSSKVGSDPGPKAPHAPRGAAPSAPHSPAVHLSGEPNAQVSPSLARSPVTNRDLVYPTVAIHATPSPQARNQPVSFSSTGSADGDGSVSSYFWDFGDGSTSTEANPQHGYAFAGPKHIVLYVTDNDGLTSQGNTDVEITGATPIQQLAGCWSNSLIRNDDGSSTEAEPLGFTVNFFGHQHGSVWVNNNGNVTFDAPLSTYTPFSLANTEREIIAPFFGDVDTRGLGSDIASYGTTTVDGHAAFCVNWGGEGGAVGYFARHTDKTNRFQLLLIDRSDVGAGDFDIETNYDQAQWETGDASDGTEGHGGTPARVGYSNGTGNPGTFFEQPGSASSGALLDGGANSLTAGSRGTVTLGRYIYEVRNGAAPTGGQIHGTVSDASGPVGRAPVEVCPHAGGTCIVTHTNTLGGYSVAGVTAGDYDITAFPPASDSGHTSGSAGPVTLAENGDVTQDVSLPAVQAPPDDMTVTHTDTGASGEPIIYWAEPLTVKTNGCPEGHAHFQIVQDGSVIREADMPLDHTEGGTGVFVAHTPELYPAHGNVVFRITVSGCSNSASDRDQSWNAYIDPSGLVKTTAGTPVVGATVTLYRSDSAAGPFTSVPNGSDVMSPVNRTNPDVTNGDGHFGWDVLAGFYKVRAEKAGCHSPDDPGRGFTETGVLTIPPPVTSLDLRLDCPDAGGTQSDPGSGTGEKVPPSETTVLTGPIAPTLVTTPAAPNIPTTAILPKLAVSKAVSRGQLKKGFKVRLINLKAKSNVVGTLKLKSALLSSARAKANAAGKATVTFKLKKAALKKAKKKRVVTVRTVVFGQSGKKSTLVANVRVK